MRRDVGASAVLVRTCRSGALASFAIATGLNDRPVARVRLGEGGASVDGVGVREERRLSWLKLDGGRDWVRVELVLVADSLRAASRSDIEPPSGGIRLDGEKPTLLAGEEGKDVLKWIGAMGEIT